MMEVINVDIQNMLIMGLLLILPVGIFIHLKIGKTKDLLIASGRMVVQLILVGIYLQYLFLINNPFLNLGWLTVMVTVSSLTTIKKSGLRIKLLFLPVFGATLASLTFSLIFMIFFVITPDPVLDARYLVPLGGMILGNCLRANIIILDRFYNGVKERYQVYLGYLFNGATLNEAAMPFFRESVSKASAPTISAMASIGLVSLPGMMTGQILGGSFPIVAIKYQIIIMIAILSTTVLSSFLSILFTRNTAFDKSDNLKIEIFTE